MDAKSLQTMLALAAGLGVIHTAAGPDHYLPFVAMSKAGRWSTSKTLLVTMLCGIAHILGSVALWGIALTLGWAVGRIEGAESARGQIAAWLMLAAGIVYTIIGILRAHRSPDRCDSHRDGHDAHCASSATNHEYGQRDEIHAAVLATVLTQEPPAIRRAPWVLFLIFIFGPCEPLIPLLLIPSATLGTTAVIAVGAAFGAATILTMCTAVLCGCWGLKNIQFGAMRRYSHVCAGLTLTACGAAMTLGL